MPENSASAAAYYFIKTERKSRLYHAGDIASFKNILKYQFRFRINSSRG